MEARFNKIFKDVQASARQFANLGLQYSVKAVGNTVTRLQAFEETLKHRVEKLNAPARAEDAPKAGK